MHKPVVLISASLLLAMLFSLLPVQTQAREFSAAPPQSGAEVLGAVNALRISNGLAPYVENSILNQIAQAQADYLAATGGSAGHTGPGGTRPIDRAMAAGYSAVFFSENWQSGSGLSAAGAVSIWTGDAPHLNTMLSASLVDAGAGVSKSGSVVYYVLDAGAQGGSTGGSGSGSTGGTTVAPGTPIVSQFMVPVTINTPNADGLVYHEVAYGQSLWSIAIAYGTKIELIKQLNNLGDIEIYVGQKLLVLRGPTPVPPTHTLESVPTTAVTETAPSTAPATHTPLAPGTTPATGTATPRTDASSSASPNLTPILIVFSVLIFAAIGTWLGTRRTV